MGKIITSILVTFCIAWMFFYYVFVHKEGHKEEERIKENLISENEQKTINNKNDEDMINSNTGILDSEENENKDEEDEDKKTSFKVEKLIDNDDITIDNINNLENIKDSFLLTGKVNNDKIDKIMVSFSNKDASLEEDNNFELKEFTKGKKTFKYTALKKSPYNVLGYGENNYLIEGYIGDNVVSKVKVVLFLSNKNIVKEKITLEDLKNKLPFDAEKYGNPEIKDGNIIYPNINGLKIYLEEKPNDFTCDNDVISNYLKNKNKWYYWMKCRDIDTNGIGISTLTSEDGIEYKFEEKYINNKYNFNMDYILEEGNYTEEDGEKKDFFSHKFKELKEKEFPNTEKVLELFKNIK